MIGGSSYHKVLFNTYKYWYTKGERSRALSELTTFLKTTQVNPLPSDRLPSPLYPLYPPSLPFLSTLTRSFIAHSNSSSNSEARIFRARCLIKRADWMRELNEGCACSAV